MMDTIEPSQLSPADMANALSMAAIAPVLAGVVERLHKDVAAISTKYRKLAKLNPSPTPAGSSTPAPAPKSDAPIGDWVASQLKGKR